MRHSWTQNENRIFRLNNCVVFEDIETIACLHDVPNQWAFEVFMELIVQGYSYGTATFEDAMSIEVLRMKLKNS